MSQTVDPKLDQAQSFFKRAVWDNWVTAILTAFEAQAPYLVWGPIKWVIESVVRHFTDKLFEFQKLEVDVLAIAFLNSEHQKVFDRELVKLKIISRNHGTNSSEYQEAEKDAFNALEKFAHYNGAKPR